MANKLYSSLGCLHHLYTSYSYLYLLSLYQGTLSLTLLELKSCQSCIIKVAYARAIHA